MWNPSAHVALNHRRETAAVVEEYGLASVGQRVAHSLEQSRRERTVHHLATAQVFHVNHLYLRQLYVLVSGHYAHQPVLACERVVVTLSRGRGRTEQHLRAAHRRKHYCRRARMVAGSWVLLLERRLVLLVNDDETEIGERQKQRRARAEYHSVGMVGQLSVPYLNTFGVAVLRMIYAQTVAEDVAQTLHYLHRKGYLRQQIEHLAAFAQGFVYQMNVYFGLSARRHTVQQRHVLRLECLLYLVVSPLLCFAQSLHVLGMSLSAVAYAPHLTLVCGEKSARDKRPQRCGGGVGLVQKFLARQFHNVIT